MTGIEDLEVAVKSSLGSSRGRPSAGMARGWNKLPSVLATAAVVLAVGLPGGPFGPHMAQAAVENSRLSSIESDLALGAATVESVTARSEFVVPGKIDKKGGGGDKGHGGAD